MKPTHSNTFEGADMTTPGHFNRTKRLKYVTVTELLADVDTANREMGRTYCPVGDYLRAMIAQGKDDDIIEAETHIWNHPEWGPSFLCETITNCTKRNNADTHPLGDVIAAQIQHDAALALVKLPWASTRPDIERMLRNPDTRFVDPNALYIILAYFNRHHPNPRKFLEKPEVRPKLGGVEIERFAAPSFDVGANQTNP